MNRKWRLTYSATTWNAIRAEAEAIAEEYRSGQLIRRWEAPRMIALHGRDPWPAEIAARDAYDTRIHEAKVTEEYPTVAVETHYQRKLARTA